MAGAAAGSTSFAGVRLLLAGAISRLGLVALATVLEAASVGLASAVGSSSSLAIFALVVLRGFGAG